MNHHHRAKLLRHSEKCREHICESLRAAGARKVVDADASDLTRTRTKARKLVEETQDKLAEDQPVAVDAPETPLMNDGDGRTSAKR